MPRKRKRRLFKLPPAAELRDKELEDTIADHLFLLLAHLVFIFSLFLLLAPVVAFVINEETTGWILTALAFITAPMSLVALKHYRNFSPKQFWSSVCYLAKKPVMRYIALLVINLWIFLRIGLQTMIPTLGLVELYVLLGLLFSIFTREQNIKHKALVGFSLVPLLINALLCINYWLSFNPVTETYMLHWNYERVQAGVAMKGKFQRSTLVTLSNNAYSAYPGIRVFWDYEHMAHCRKITYTFKTGLFGIRVMTEYEFI